MSEQEQRVASGTEDFSFILGGPLYQLYLRTQLARPGLELVKRRILGFAAVTWLPLVGLWFLQGRGQGDVKVPLLFDVEVHARFLVSIPLLLLAEFVVHRRISGIVRHFQNRGLIGPEDQSRFDELIASTMRLRNSIPVEIVLLLVAFGSQWVVYPYMQLGGSSWVEWNEGGERHLTAAGWWYSYVSLPVFRFLVFRWYYRMFLWYRFLWKAGRLNLRLDALHPDRAGGLGFLSATPVAFTTLLLAHSVIIAAVIENRIWHSGARLVDFRFEIAGVLCCALLGVLAPLFFFMRNLAAARRKAIAEYGALASRYVSEFRKKWFMSGAGSGDALVGSADIQSLADLSGAYDAVRETRMVPITRQAVLQLLVVTAIPFAPLLLNEIPFEELLKRAVGFLF